MKAVAMVVSAEVWLGGGGGGLREGADCSDEEIYDKEIKIRLSKRGKLVSPWWDAAAGDPECLFVTQTLAP